MPARFASSRHSPQRLSPTRFVTSRFGGVSAALLPILRLLPADVGGGTFNGTTQSYSVPLAFDIVDKTILMVATVTATSSTTSTALSLHGAGAANYIELQSAVVGGFRGRLRAAGVGQAAIFIDPASPENVSANAFGQKTLFVVRVQPNGFAVTVGSTAVQTMAKSGGTDAMTTLIVGRGRTTGYTGMILHELVVLPTASDAEVQAAANSFAAAHGVTAPIFTPYLDTIGVGFGDSIMVGVGSTAGLNAFAEVAHASLLGVIERTSPVTAIAGAQVSLFGESDPAKLAVAFPNVTAQAANFAGRSHVVVSYGTNDFGQDVPLGVASDTSLNTFWGALNAGFNNLINRALPTVICLPFPRSGEHIPNSAGHVLQDYRDALAAKASASGASICDFADLWDPVTQSGVYTVDGLHPNNAGHLLGGLRLLQTIRSGISIPS